MKLFTIALCFMSITILGSNAKANDWDKKTVVHFAETPTITGVQLIPGEPALSPGATYSFRLMDTARTVVRISDEDSHRHIGFAMGIQTMRQEAMDVAQFEFVKTAKGELILTKWFFPYERAGLEFPTKEEGEIITHFAERVDL